MKRNTTFTQVSPRYLFQEVRSRVSEFKERVPHASLISLGIGDTTEPLVDSIGMKLVEASKNMMTRSGYRGYGPESGYPELRQKISEKIYRNKIAKEAIFISDGAKCDIGRLQILFGDTAKIAVLDPSYPAYLDSSLIARRTSSPENTIIRLPCVPENGFHPDLSLAKNADVLFLCSPNNPTGTAFSYDELKKAVQFAKAHKILIVFDAAYSQYVHAGHPRSIYEIDGAQEVAIELGSFSKMAGFSGLRLGWSVFPDELRYSDGELIRNDWMRLVATFFNGASWLSQEAAMAALTDRGLDEIAGQVAFYKENTKILASAFEKRNFEVFGGRHAPYLWVRFPQMTSWQAFEELLERSHIITTPGIGFGPSGEGFLRVSGFGDRTMIQEAAMRIEEGIRSKAHDFD